MVVRQQVGLLAGFRGEQIAEIKTFNTWQEAVEATDLIG
jgi:hypothetical protein